ncbi:uncharacterized protein LOC143145644 [Ptiloglossa arizonensis]|uniref:uncharacterized protein LOC143145644 n=1 Tax=Ptiloglossa arizonensis TaxID=3350558 RepID=UPI003F9F1A39
MFIRVKEFAILIRFSSASCVNGNQVQLLSAYRATNAMLDTLLGTMHENTIRVKGALPFAGVANNRYSTREFRHRPRVFLVAISQNLSLQRIFARLDPETDWTSKLFHQDAFIYLDVLDFHYGFVAGLPTLAIRGKLIVSRKFLYLLRSVDISSLTDLSISRRIKQDLLGCHTDGSTSRPGMKCLSLPFSRFPSSYLHYQKLGPPVPLFSIG